MNIASLKPTQRALAMIGAALALLLIIAFTVSATLDFFRPQDVPVRMITAQNMDDEQWMQSNSVDRSGNALLATSVQDHNSSVAHRIIDTLKQENQALIEELAKAQQRIVEIQDEIPRTQAQARIAEKEYQRSISDAKHARILALQKQIVTIDTENLKNETKETGARAAILAYETMLRRSADLLDPKINQAVKDVHLPAFALCIGRNVEFVAPSRYEKLLLLRYLKSENEQGPLPPQLQADYQTIYDECYQSLVRQLLRRQLNTEQKMSP